MLCYGITPDDHEWLQANRGDVELCAAYMYERDIACALAHPYYHVAAPLSARHRRRLAQLFDVWEVRNGARARELNRPAATYVATLDGIGIGGSDDHAGIDIGRTWTESPPRARTGGVPRARSAWRCQRGRRAGKRRQVGARGDRAGGARARRRRARDGDRGPRSGEHPATGRAPLARGRRTPRRGRSRRRLLAGGCPLFAARLAAGRRASATWTSPG